jgi:hypothetical protein
LGITSNAYAVTIPKSSINLYNWLIAKMEDVSPIEIVTPTKQATGYIADISEETQAGWIGVPLSSSDTLHLTATPQQVYDVAFTLVKTDIEYNIDLGTPSC